MGLFDKLKNVFIEEDFEEEEKVEKPVAVSEYEEPEVYNEKVEEQKPLVNTISDRELVVDKEDKEKFKFPIIFEEDDFVEEKKNSKSVNVLERETAKYEPPKEVRREKKVFKPSPVISPVYGVLDKNYSKEDITTKDGLLNDFDKVDIDYVIKKASGEYSKAEDKKVEEKEIDLFKQREKTIAVINDEENFTTGELEMINNEPASVEEIDKKIKSIDELLKDTTDDDFYSLVDSMYKDEDKGDEE